MRSWVLKSCLVGCTSILLSACDLSIIGSKGSVTESSVPADWTKTKPSERKDARIEKVAGRFPRRGRRLSVDQLRRSIDTLFGGISWVVRRPGPRTNGFEVFAAALGKADYISIMAESLEPSPLFAKFMDDMAGDVCQKAVEHDRTQSSDPPLVVADAEDPDETLRFLRLKLHGIHVPKGQADEIADLRSLYGGILAESMDPYTAWYGVCVAMVTAPEFLTY